MSEELRETHIDDDGLWIPPALREFDAQIVFRTPRSTIQHFASKPLDAYYGMIRADQFGDADEFRNPINPDLAPDRVQIKAQGEGPVTLAVDLEPALRTDGGLEESQPLGSLHRGKCAVARLHRTWTATDWWSTAINWWGGRGASTAQSDFKKPTHKGGENP